MAQDKDGAAEVPEITDEAMNAAADAAVAAFDAADSLEDLAEARRTHLGDASVIARARQGIGSLPKTERKNAGKIVNQARGRVEKHYAGVKKELEARRVREVLAAERVDVTVPTTRRQTGALHPITALSEQIADIFLGMGWEIADGPEIEAEYFNFDALNFIPDHPARTLQDTFYVGTEDSGQLLDLVDAADHQRAGRLRDGGVALGLEADADEAAVELGVAHLPAGVGVVEDAGEPVLRDEHGSSWNLSEKAGVTGRRKAWRRSRRGRRKAA